MLGQKYKNGQGLPLNRKKALELWSRAAKFGSVEAQFRIASAHFNGDGILAKIRKRLCITGSLQQGIILQLMRDKGATQTSNDFEVCNIMVAYITCSQRLSRLVEK